ncbi:hypothetical protein OXV40_34380, partial [Burkholderia contaminans]|uniref:hypothetical protein n=1 Tax=Burkholderia contaminans TaxID=488447 RepID=UPI002D7F1C10
MHIQTTVVALAMVGLSACTAVVPQTQYKVISTPADMQGVTDSFYLQATQISISQNGATTKLTRSNAGKTVTNVSVASVPTEYKDLKLGIRPVNDWRSSTMLNITKLDNTDLVISIG